MIFTAIFFIVPSGHKTTPVENSALLAIMCKQFHFPVQLHSDGMDSCHPVNRKSNTGKNCGIKPAPRHNAHCKCLGS